MESIQEFFDENYAPVLMASGVVVVALLSYFISKRVLVRLLRFAAKKTRSSWDDVLVEEGVFGHLPYLAPAAVFYLGAHLFPVMFLEPIHRITTAYIAVNVVILIDKLLNTGLVIYRRYPISKERPIKGYIQIIKIFLYVIGGIVVISLLIDQSPWAFLGGLGALTAVLLLIFRDTILSFVASIQISSNDMVRVGDWIEMPKYAADGDVIEMALNTVKIQNFDKTITTIPTYKLVEDSFKNWRGMQASGGRRIARSMFIDQSSVRFIDEEMVDRFKKIEVLKPYLESKEEELAEYHEEKGIDMSEILNGRRLTNIGTFRAYVVAYLKNHPRVRDDMTFLVRLLAPTPEGIPLQMYLFTNTTAWVEYEAIQSDIFDHLLAAISEFDLKVFQKPTGQDVASLNIASKSAQ